MEKKTEKQFTNPFSDKFLEKWELWKEYKLEAHNFRYKGVISEQMAIVHLVELSDGDEEKAEKILNQSIRRLWQGFFPLKETTHGTKQPTTKQPEPSLRDQAQSVYNSRNGVGEQPTSGDHLKAV